MLQMSDPFKKKTCNRKDCPICTSGGKGNCYKQNVTYKIECLGCDHELNGETSDSGYTRIIKHLQDLKNQNEKVFSSLRNHCNEHHGGVIQKFKASITKTFKDDAMGRQITEATKIKAVPTNRSMNTRREWNTTRIPRVNIE